jgi:hypothetical protein
MTEPTPPPTEPAEHDPNLVTLDNIAHDLKPTNVE